MSGVHSPSSGFLQRAWVTSPGPPFAEHSLSAKVWKALHHNWRYSWWLSCGIGISKVLGSSAATRLYFHQECLQGSFQGAKPQLLCIIPSSLLPRLDLYQCLLLDSPSAKPQLLFMTPSLPPKPVPSGWHLHHQVLLPVWGTSLATSGTELLCADSQEKFPRRFHLLDAGLFMVTLNFLAPVDKNQLSE